ncbi:MAG: DUF2442 domain-containing protein [Clostridia bacterium]|nr:DUF2442 domain-containing protein [Clostridia bacterium]
MEPNPICVKAIENYCIYLEFEDGKKKIYDMSYLIKNNPVYNKLKDEEYFKKVKVAGETVEWPNGEDVCPENLYYDSKEV